MNANPDIFQLFERQQVTTDGQSVYDFLGGHILAHYKSGWDKGLHKKGDIYSPNYPPATEWTIDWVACLLAAKLAKQQFNVIELGAGYGQWLVTAVMAFKQLHPELPAKGVALEADSTHYEWLLDHVSSNLSDYSNVSTDLVRAAAGFDGEVSFPAIENPAADYGASYIVNQETGTNTVKCHSLPSIYDRFGDDQVDLLHIDIQGAERELVSHPEFTSTLNNTNVVLFGTHRDTALHESVRKALEKTHLKIIVEWPRHALINTPYGNIKTTDGALLAVNGERVSETESYLDLIALNGNLL